MTCYRLMRRSIRISEQGIMTLNLSATSICWHRAILSRICMMRIARQRNLIRNINKDFPISLLHLLLMLGKNLLILKVL